MRGKYTFLSFSDFQTLDPWFPPKYVTVSTTKYAKICHCIHYLIHGTQNMSLYLIPGPEKIQWHCTWQSTHCAVGHWLVQVQRRSAKLLSHRGALHRATTVPLNLCDCFDDNDSPILHVVWVRFVVEQKEEQGMKLRVLYKTNQIIVTSKKDGENRTLRKHLPLSSNFRQKTQWNPIKPNIMWPYHLP